MEKQKEEPITKQREVWDCGSSLYDSFELKSLQHQLNSAITSSRTMSMPHLSLHRQPPPPPPPPPSTTNKKHSKISRSLHKFLRSVFRPKHTHKNLSTHGVFYVYDTTGALSTIPEVPETLPEFDGLSPEMKYSLVKRSRSDRFMSTSSLGISCV